MRECFVVFEKRESDGECGAAAFLAADGVRSAVNFPAALHDHESEAGAANLSDLVSAVETLKKAPDVRCGMPMP